VLIAGCAAAVFSTTFLNASGLMQRPGWITATRALGRILKLMGGAVRRIGKPDKNLLLDTVPCSFLQTAVCRAVLFELAELPFRVFRIALQRYFASYRVSNSD